MKRNDNVLAGRLAQGILVCLALSATRAGFAQNDLTLGGDARAYAMGGAGIALIQNDTGGTRVNAASLAYEKQKFNFRFPSFAIRSDNDLSTSKIYNVFISGKLKDAGNFTDLARSYASTDSSFGINGNTTLRYGNVEVGGAAVAKGYVQPNDSLKNFARSGGTTIPNDARADVIAAGYATIPSVAMGFKLPQPKSSRNDYAVGVRLKAMRAYYTHYVADANNLNGNGNSVIAPELGGKDYLQKSGFGTDVGFLMLPRRGKNDLFSAGLVVANLIRPSFKFNGTDRNGAPVNYDLVRTSASAGVGFVTHGITLAGDLVDLTGSVGKTQLRLGGEVKFPFNLAIRGGYSSGHGFSYGAGLFGFDIAVAKRQPLEIVRTLHF